jgi:hypothetical protein
LSGAGDILKQHKPGRGLREALNGALIVGKVSLEKNSLQFEKYKHLMACVTRIINVKNGARIMGIRCQSIDGH